MAKDQVQSPMEEWSDFRYFAQAEHFNTKNFFLRVLNTKNFTHYHDMFPFTAGKKVCFRSISQHSYILLCLLSKKILSILLMVHFISIPGT